MRRKKKDGRQDCMEGSGRKIKERELYTGSYAKVRKKKWMAS